MPTLKQLQNISFLVILLGGFILVAWMLKPFVNILALALILTILFRPLFRRLYSLTGRKSVASGLTVLVMLLIIAIPLWLFGQVIFNELKNLYEEYRNGGFVIDRQQIISAVPAQLQGVIENFSRDINNAIGSISANAFSSISALLSNIAGFIIAFFILFFIVFFMLRDGDHIKAVLMDISPIAANHETKLFDRIVASVNGVVKGSFLVALVQGVVATIGFLIFGIPQPFLWGLFTVLAALVPNVGTGISLVPAVIYLVVTGHATAAIGLAIWGAVAVGLVDNIIGPRLIGGSAKLHPVLVLLSVLGGIQLFGILGFLIGPIVMAVFVALVEMYRTEFKDYLENK